MKIFSQGNEKHEEGLKVLVAQSHLTHHDPMDGSLPGSSVHGIFQARIHPGRGLLWGRWILYWLIHHTCMHAQLLKLCLTLCDPVNCSPPGSSVHGIPQARILEWVAMFSYRGSSQPRSQTCISYDPA